MTTDTSALQNRGEEQIEDAERTRDRRVSIPRADVVETGDSIVVVADMPGVKEDGVNITLEKNVLSIVGTVAEEDRSGYRQAYREYAEADYERSFALSESIDRNGIEATVKDGVLRLSLPKSKEAAARKIAVRAG